MTKPIEQVDGIKYQSRHITYIYLTLTKTITSHYLSFLFLSPKQLHLQNTINPTEHAKCAHQMQPIPCGVIVSAYWPMVLNVVF